MSGITKRFYEDKIRDLKLMLNNEIESIKNLLPLKYEKKDIIALLKKYYPHEWNSVEYLHNYYRTKDKYLYKKNKEFRYCMPSPEKLIEGVKNYKKLFSKEYMNKYEENYSEEYRIKSHERLWHERENKINKINHKIEAAKKRTQQVTPEFIDQLIGLYSRIRTTQKDKVYILAELKKYYCEKVIQFFIKLNDIELNKQLRQDVFKYLQSFNYNFRLRKQKYMILHTKNKKRRKFLKDIYINETYNIPFCPDELEYRIENSSEQKLKSFDFFISHSSKDSKYVQYLINNENKNGKNIFCDWINDNDYLKRHLLCHATLKVIEYRLKQSNALIFVLSENSLNSDWCTYELNYFNEFKRPMYYIKLDSIKNNKLEIKLIEDKWFINPEYKKLVLFK